MCAKKSKGKLLKSIGEFGLIDIVKKGAKYPSSVLKGIGDDAAVLSCISSKNILFSTDMLVEGVHFTKKMNIKLVGRKSIACSISDIAAMGGSPKYAVISLGISPKEKVSSIKQLYSGMLAICKKYNVAIVGGDVVKSAKMVINVAITGEADKKDIVLRSGAKPKDQIFVTGKLGNSYKSGKHLKFEPRIKESQYLVKNFKPTAMMDISDGLASDLGHIINESKVGADIFAEQLPLSKNAKLKNALFDGEDFELLFTVDKKTVAKLKRSKKYKFVHIGEITKQKGIINIIDAKGNKKKLKGSGYRHF